LTASTTPGHAQAAPSDRVALNPIQWMASADGWLDPSLSPAPEQLLGLIKKAGFRTVMAQVPAGWSVRRYQDALAASGLGLAPGYFVCRSDGMDGGEDEVLRAAAAAAREHARLGLHDAGLGMGMAKDAPRVTRPAQGAEPDPARLTALTQLIGRIGEVMRAEGVRPALHPHVGTWVETEQEGRTVLDAISPDLLGFLPDTGHLAWAGADVGKLIADYAGRLAFVHVKDCRLSVAERGRAAGWTYQQTVLAGLWTEPGRGELPLTALLEALPDGFDGALMVEVDRPDISDPFESARVSASWMHDTRWLLPTWRAES
jgi:inosose dehydratase